MSDTSYTPKETYQRTVSCGVQKLAALFLQELADSTESSFSRTETDCSVSSNKTVSHWCNRAQKMTRNQKLSTGKTFPAFLWQLGEDKRRWKCWTFGFKEIIGAIALTGVQSDAPAERRRFRRSAYWSCWFRQRISAKHSSNLHVSVNLLQENDKACFLYSFTLL